MVTLGVNSTDWNQLLLQLNAKKNKNRYLSFAVKVVTMYTEPKKILNLVTRAVA
jgi:hypothetical protein